MSIFADIEQAAAEREARINARWDRCDCGFRVEKGTPMRAHFDLTKGAMMRDTAVLLDEVAAPNGYGAITRVVPRNLAFWVCAYGPNPVMGSAREGKPVNAAFMAHYRQREATKAIRRALEEHPTPATVQVTTQSGTAYELFRSVFNGTERIFLRRDGSGWSHVNLLDPEKGMGLNVPGVPVPGGRSSVGYTTTPVVSWQVVYPKYDVEV